MTRDQQRRLHRIRNPLVRSSERVLRLMAEGGLMTVARAQSHLDVETQSARNCLCKLVRQGHIAVVTGKAAGRPGTYRITAAGISAIAELDGRLHGYEVDTPGLDLAAEKAERDAARALIDVNLAHARAMVPRSVFDLGGRLAAHPPRAHAHFHGGPREQLLTSVDSVRAAVREETAVSA